MRIFGHGDSVISSSTMVFDLLLVDGGTVNGRGRCSAIKGAAHCTTLLTPRPDRGFMAGTKRKRYVQADRGRGRGRDRGKKAVTVAVAVVVTGTERKRDIAEDERWKSRKRRRVEEGRTKGTQRVATAESQRAAGWRGDTKTE